MSGNSDAESSGRASMTAADVSTELSMRRTGMSFQRTRMSADRTLMAVIKTSLSLISFGFTIFQFFRSLKQAGSVTEEALESARNFGVSLMVVGVGMLIVGLGYHFSFMRALRRERKSMAEDGLIHAETPYPFSLTVIVALLLLVIGLVALFGMLVRSGPFV
jgi:putative membrane protein